MTQSENTLPDPERLPEVKPEKPEQVYKLLDVVLISVGVVAGMFLAVMVGQWLTPEQDALTLLGTSAILVVQSLTMIASVVLLGYLRRRLDLSAAGFRRMQWWWLPVAAAVALGLLSVRLGIGAAAQMVLDPNLETAQALNDALFPEVTLLAAVVLTILTGFLIPIAEEMFFRGVVFKWLRGKLSLWPAILISSLFFAAAHIYIPQALPAFVIGIALAWTYEKSDSLWVPITIHVVNNAVVVMLAFVALLLAEWLGIPY